MHWALFQRRWAAHWLVRCRGGCRNRLNWKQFLAGYWPFLRIGLVLFGANVSMFLALRWVEPSVVSFFTGLQVLWVTVIELLLRRIRFNFMLGLSILLCLAGTLYINEILQFVDGHFRLQLKSFTIGEFLAMLSGGFFGLTIHLIRKFQDKEEVQILPSSPAQTAALLNSVIALENFIIIVGIMLYTISQGSDQLFESVGFARFQEFLPWLYPLLLGLGSFLGATLLQIHSQKYLSGSQVGVLLALQLIATIVLGLLFFDSVLQLNQIIGGAMLLGASIFSIIL